MVRSADARKRKVLTFVQNVDGNVGLIYILFKVDISPERKSLAASFIGEPYVFASPPTDLPGFSFG